MVFQKPELPPISDFLLACFFILMCLFVVFVVLTFIEIKIRKIFAEASRQVELEKPIERSKSDRDFRRGFDRV